MEWIIILAGISFWVILIIVKRNSFKKQEAEGILVDRPTRFAESGEEFTAKVGSVDELDKAISGMLIPKGVSVQAAKNNESIRFDFISTYFTVKRRVESGTNCELISEDSPLWRRDRIGESTIGAA